MLYLDRKDDSGTLEKKSRISHQAVDLVPSEIAKIHFSEAKKSTGNGTSLTYGIVFELTNGQYVKAGLHIQ